MPPSKSGQSGSERAVRRGEIYWAQLPAIGGSAQAGKRPVIIVQNDTGNRFSPTTIVAAMTSRLKRSDLPVHVVIAPEASGLEKPGMVLCEQLFTLPKEKLGPAIGRTTREDVNRIDRALKVSLSLD